MAIALANDLIFKEINTIDVFDVTTGDFMFTMDELTNYSIAHTEEMQDVTGKNGRILSRTKRNKGITISGTNGVISAGMLALQLGGEYTNGNTTIMWTDYLTITSNEAATKYVAIGTSGAEIVSLLVKNTNNGIDTELEQAATAAAGKFTYAPGTKKLVFNAGDYADGTQIVVRYKRQISATVIKNDSDKYSGMAMMYVNGLAEDKCANQYRVQFYLPKVDFSGEFTIDFGDTQTVHNFEATAMAGACGAGDTYYTYTVFGTTTADVPVN